MRFAPYLCAFGLAVSPAVAVASEWQALDATALTALQDDDLDRHRADMAFLSGLGVSEIRISENGFDWHMLRFSSQQQPNGPLWVVPHDDENAAFDAMIAALKRHGGVGIAVNSGQGSSRRQPGYGLCGVRAAMSAVCDPNRNFDARTPLFTAAILKQLQPGQPVIALHTNGPGFGGDGRGGRGDITMLDTDAYARGAVRVREGGYLAYRNVAGLGDPDVYAIIPYRAGTAIGSRDTQCRTALNTGGVNVWHERVDESDGSLSNYIALNRPEVAYVNFEAKRESDLSIAAAAQALMIDAYLANCSSLWDKPVSSPAIAR